MKFFWALAVIVVCNLVQINGEKCAPNFHIENGKVEEEGDHSILNCNEGYIAVPSNILNCEGGNLTSKTSCFKTECPKFTQKNGNIIYNTENGFTAKIVCDARFRLSGNTETLCQVNQWTPELGNCAAFPKNADQGCQVLSKPENGAIAYKNRDGKESSAEEASTAEIKCVAGFQVSGTNYTSCKDQQWTSELGICKAIPESEEQGCQAMSKPENGKIIYEDKQGVNSTPEKSSKAKIICDAGFKVAGNGDATCEKKGVWSHALGSCQKATEDEQPSCPELKPENATVTYYNKEGAETTAPNGIKAEIACSKGFILNGINKTICDKKEWSPPLGTCEKTPGGEPTKSNTSPKIESTTTTTTTTTSSSKAPGSPSGENNQPKKNPEVVPMDGAKSNPKTFTTSAPQHSGAKSSNEWGKYNLALLICAIIKLLYK